MFLICPPKLSFLSMVVFHSEPLIKYLVFRLVCFAIYCSCESPLCFLIAAKFYLVSFLLLLKFGCLILVLFLVIILSFLEPSEV